MPISSFNSFNQRGIICAWPAIFALAMAPITAHAKTKPESFAVSPAPVRVEAPQNGAIFNVGTYAALTSGARASQVGDILTVILSERTSATKSTSTATDRNGGFGLTPPTTGPFSLFKPSDVNVSGTQTFKGKGETAQSNSLAGEMSVTVTAVYPNGTMLVRGEKLLTLNRGDEHVRLSGLVRSVDISPDNRVSSSRIADAHILYTGKGEVANASKQGWLQRFFSKVSPF